MKKLLLAVIVVVLAVGGAFYWFVLRDDPAPELSLEDGGPGASTAFSPDGTWAVGNGSQAGLRIDETFLGGAATHTAVGRTDQVEGSMTITGDEVSKATFTVDMASIGYTDTPPGLNVANRSNAMARAGLDTNNFPDATFELTTPITLGSPKVDARTTYTATGDLTIHGVTKKVSFKVDTKAVNQTTPKILVASTDPVPVKLSDYGIDSIANIGPVAKVADQGSFEFRLVFVQ